MTQVSSNPPPSRSGPHGMEKDQREAIAFLADPTTYHGVQTVQRCETHGNLVFLAGDTAFKIKRAVRFDYMDFSTLEKRRIACHREVELNRRWAADLYLGCVALKQSSSGKLSFNGDGETVEWAVQMRRFDQADLLSARAAEGRVDTDLAVQLAYAVFSSHEKADRITQSSGVAAYQKLVRTVVNALTNTHICNDSETSQLAAALERKLDRAAAVIDERAREGFVRRCHGDLHLANIVVWHGRPLLYDAIEFDEALATVDTLYDLAFLLMDLEFHNLRPVANVVLNRYLWCSGDERDLCGLAALPLFLALRAAIRAMVTVDRAAQEEAQGRDRDLVRARRYFDAALRYVLPSAPRLLAIAGLSGTGKSTLAAALAPRIGSAPGAVHLRSDLERKLLAGVREFDRLPATAYTREARHRVYTSLHHKAQLIIAAQHSVVVDAVYDSETERREVEKLAQRLDVPLCALWLHADQHVLLARVGARHRDASDATMPVVEAQLAANVGPLSEQWTSLDASGGSADTLGAATIAAGLARAPSTG